MGMGSAMAERASSYLAGVPLDSLCACDRERKVAAPNAGMGCWPGAVCSLLTWRGCGAGLRRARQHVLSMLRTNAACITPSDICLLTFDEISFKEYLRTVKTLSCIYVRGHRRARRRPCTGR